MSRQLVDALYASQSWWDNYTVLCAVPDNSLQRFADQVRRDPRNASSALGALLVDAAVANASVRLAGFLTITLDPETETDPVTAVCADAFGHAHVSAALSVVHRLVAELVALVELLSAGVWPYALRAAARVAEVSGGEIVDLAVVLAGRAPRTHAERAGLDDLTGIIHQVRYERSGRVEDLDTAIEYGDQALRVTPDDAPDRPGRLGNQASRLILRYERSGRVEDLDSAIAYGDQALHRTLILNCCVSATNAANLHDETLSIATIALTHRTRKATVALWPLDDDTPPPGPHAATWATHHHQLTPPPNHLPTTAAYLTYG